MTSLPHLVERLERLKGKIVLATEAGRVEQVKRYRETLAVLQERWGELTAAKHGSAAASPEPTPAKAEKPSLEASTQPLRDFLPEKEARLLAKARITTRGQLLTAINAADHPMVALTSFKGIGQAAAGRILAALA